MRTSCVVNAAGDIEGRFTVALPAAGRTIQGHWAATVLVQQLPSLVQASLTFPLQNAQAIKEHIESVEDQQSLRAQIGAAGLVAFGASSPLSLLSIAFWEGVSCVRLRAPTASS